MSCDISNIRPTSPNHTIIIDTHINTLQLKTGKRLSGDKENETYYTHNSLWPQVPEPSAYITISQGKCHYVKHWHKRSKWAMFAHILYETIKFWVHSACVDKLNIILLLLLKTDIVDLKIQKYDYDNTDYLNVYINVEFRVYLFRI